MPIEVNDLNEIPHSPLNENFEYAVISIENCRIVDSVLSSHTLLEYQWFLKVVNVIKLNICILQGEEEYYNK